MPGRVLGLNAGSARGNTEIMLVAALRAAREQGADVQLVRLDELHLPFGPDAQEPDDAWWLWDQLMESDGLIVSSPVFSRSIPGRLKLFMDRVLGPNADRAIVERMLAMRSRGEEPAVRFRLDERVLRPRVAGFLAVGGALETRWTTLALPTLHTFTFSMQVAVVDQVLVTGAGTPRSVVLDDAALQRSAQLGRNVAAQLGREFDDAEYVGDPGICPLCHLSVVEIAGRRVTCATCGAGGELGSDGTVRWTEAEHSVYTMSEKREHYQEILDTATRQNAQRDLIEDRAASYAADDLLSSPPTRGT